MLTDPVIEAKTAQRQAETLAAIAPGVKAAAEKLQEKAATASASAAEMRANIMAAKDQIYCWLEEVGDKLQEIEVCRQFQASIENPEAARLQAIADLLSFHCRADAYGFSKFLAEAAELSNLEAIAPAFTKALELRQAEVDALWAIIKAKVAEFKIDGPALLKRLREEANTGSRFYMHFQANRISAWPQ